MNELQRQHYLSALGIDSYMPRWHLPFAPESIVCQLPDLNIQLTNNPSEVFVTPPVNQSLQNQHNSDLSLTSVPSINHFIGDILETKKVDKPVVAPAISAADILAQFEERKPATIEPFSLSVWRPLEGVMVVDSRNTKFALPTELFVNNILRAIFFGQIFKAQEEVLRWPMIENSFAKRTADDARNELQTWLSVQHEIRTIRYLWLMGENAATYLLPDTVNYPESLYKVVSVTDSSIRALILPSLNELLQNPRLKQQLFLALRLYHSAS